MIEEVVRLEIIAAKFSSITLMLWSASEEKVIKVEGTLLWACSNSNKSTIIPFERPATLKVRIKPTKRDAQSYEFISVTTEIGI